MHGKDVGILDAARIYPLMRLHGGQRSEAIAIDGGALEFKIGGGLVHLGCELILDGLTLAGQERVRLAHELAVMRKVDLAGTGAGAALDLIEQTGPRAALEETVRAGPQQECTLESGDGAIDRPDGRERPVVIALARLGAAMLEDCGAQ